MDMRLWDQVSFWSALWTPYSLGTLPCYGSYKLSMRSEKFSPTKLLISLGFSKKMFCFKIRFENNVRIPSSCIEDICVCT